MKAIVCTKYGPPEVLQYREVPKPVPKNNEVLIRIHATAVTASDCIVRKFRVPAKNRFPKGVFMELMMGIMLGFGKPRNPILGMVFAGEIESTGKHIKRFKKGDKVFGFTVSVGIRMRFGTYSEYMCLSEKYIIALKPSGISYEEAAAIPYGGMLAMYFLKKGKIESRKKVLVYGASGAIGTMAIQIAGYFGAEVTGVCSTKNLELVRSLGAGNVIDYTKEDHLPVGELFDLVFDAVGEFKSSALKLQCKKALTAKGKYISVDHGSPKSHMENIELLKKLAESGHIKAIIDKIFPLEQMVEAHRYVDRGHKKGSVVIKVSDN